MIHRSPRCPLRQMKSGFTLIEVIGALVIFTVGVLGAINLSGGLGRRIDGAALRTRVVEVAHEAVDSMRAQGYDALVPGDAGGTLEIAARSYRVDRSIIQYSPLVRRLVVSVTPVSGSGPAHSVTSFISTDW
ncbi:MAG: prepilin-type N-terminal cleavage/methylation domain-containing protein [Longimicrobiales bacterium]|nr:prepilin-type N-terminal cleavage/methylation domain-containing protein [Longimicrobiales bacterium]